MIQLLILALLPLNILAESKIGCYSSLPSSYTDKSTYEYQSSAHCSSQCSDYSYFALEGGNTCICGNTAPSGSQSSSCDTPCYGYGEETCGGDGVYDFYSTGNSGGSDSSSSGSSATSSTDDSTSSTSDSTSTTSSNTDTTSTTKQSTTTGGTSSTATAVSTSSADGTTIVIMSTVAASQSSSTASSSETSSSTSTSSTASASSSSGSSDHKKKTNLVGPVVGGVVGGIAAIAVVSLLFFFLRRRSSAKHDAELADSAYFNAVKRDNSTLTRPLSNPFLSKEDFTDQRLNPVMLGRRRISEGSLADEADYSRKILRVANPDDDL